jgi:hypothetical protein
MNNLFNLDNEDYKSFEGTIALNVGTPENIAVPVQLISIEVDEKENLLFTFQGTEDGNKGTFTHRVWANTFDTEHEYFQDWKVAQEMGKIRQIIKAYVENPNFEASSWKSFTKGVIKLLTGKFENVDVKIKLVYNNSGYASLPKTHKVPFISSELNPQRLSYNAQYDNLVKPEAPVENSTPSDDVDTSFDPHELSESLPSNGVSDELPDDLPFA